MIRLLKKIKTFFDKKIVFKTHWQLACDFKIESFSNDLKSFVVSDNKFKPFIIKNKMEIYNPEVFFEKDKNELNAYDFASLWFCFAKHHKHRFLPTDESDFEYSRAFMISFCNKSENKNILHMVTILYDYYKKKYIICDYNLIEEHNLFLDCIQALRKKYQFNENVIVSTYQEF